PRATRGAPDGCSRGRPRCSRRSARWTSRSACARRSPRSTDASKSPPDDETLPAHVGGAEQRAMPRVHAGERGAGIHHERPREADPVAEPSKRLHDAGSDAVLQLQPTAVEAVVAEALAIMQRVEPWRFDGLLRTHIEDRDVQ